MIEWWNNMDLVGQIFALIAVPSTLVLVVQTILLLVGIGGDDLDADGVDITGNGIGDTPGDGGADGLALFSLRGIMAMAAVGGWSGLVMYEAGIDLTVTVVLAAAFGFMALVGIAYLMKLAARLQQDGTLDLGYAIGKVGTVYIPIPAEMKGSGKISLTMQERFIEVDAMTTSGRKLSTGESVRVTATNENGMVVVEPIA
ncbi:MAG: hypothetical protein IKU40_11380 [Clostridia bacterium]|nr:hypothetical protein [Clostridia bacterium]